MFRRAFGLGQRPSRLALLAASGGIVGYSTTQTTSTSSSSSSNFDPLSLSSYTDPVRHSAIATARSSRVVACALLCFNDYRGALKGDEKSVSDCHLKCAKRVLKVLETNGGIYIKLGQHIAAMGYLLPIEWCQTMQVLEDQCPPSSIASLREMFLHDTGHELEDVFSEFDTKPIGVASLAQVHRAVLKDTGREVAIKFQHPALREFCEVDQDTTRFSFQLIKRFFPDFQLGWLSEELDLSLPQELNFVIEGQNAMETRHYFQKVKGSSLYVPEVIWAQPRILVMEFIRGKRVDDLAFLSQHNINRNDVSAELARCFNEMIFFAPKLHCDPHGGNVFIRPRPPGSQSAFNFEIVLLDHGLYREIPLELKRNYAKLWLAIISKDNEAMQKYSYEVAGVSDAQYPLFASAITGRDFSSLQKGIVTVPKSADELKVINSAAGQNLLQQLVGLLAGLPRILLLLLKTNDLTRHLDESLHTSTGPERPFIILGKACSRVVYEEDLEHARAQGFFKRLFGRVQALLRYWPRLTYLNLGEIYYSMRTPTLSVT